MWFKSNDLLECIVKLTKIHKAQAGVKEDIIGKVSSLNKIWRSRYKTVSR